MAAELMQRGKARKKWLFPIRFSACELPGLDLGKRGDLASLQVTDYFGEDRKRQFERLAQELHKTRRPHRLSVRARIVTACSVVVVLAAGLFVYHAYSPGERQNTEPVTCEPRFEKARQGLDAKQAQDRVVAVRDLRRIAEGCPSLVGDIAARLADFAVARSAKDPSNGGFPPQFLADRAPDVQAAMEMLGRSPLAGAEQVDLRGVHLRRAHLKNLRLDWADLTDARLDAHSDFNGSSYRGAILTKAQFDHADMYDADLRGVTADGTIFRNAKLIGARFDERSDLSGACLVDAKFTDATGLDGARLQGALANGNTTWPDGFDPRAHGVRTLVTTSCLA